MTEDYKIESPVDAKRVVKKFKLRRKELITQRKELARQLASEYKFRAINRGPLATARYGFPSFLRFFQRANHLVTLVNTAPLEKKKIKLGDAIHGLDDIILVLEKYISENS